MIAARAAEPDTVRMILLNTNVVSKASARCCVASARTGWQLSDRNHRHFRAVDLPFHRERFQ